MKSHILISDRFLKLAAAAAMAADAISHIGGAIHMTRRALRLPDHVGSLESPAALAAVDRLNAFYGQRPRPWCSPNARARQRRKTNRRQAAA